MDSRLRRNKSIEIISYLKLIVIIINNDTGKNFK